MGFCNIYNVESCRFVISPMLSTCAMIERGNMMAVNSEINTAAIELLRNAAQNEYSNEHERTTTMDAKAGIALPIISAYFLALAQMNDYKSFSVTPVTEFVSILVPATVFMTYTAALVLAFVAVIWMTRVVFTREYLTLNLQNLYTDDYMKSDSRVLSLKFLELYFEAIEHNRSENDTRVKLYQRGWVFAFISVICFVVYIIFKNNIC